MSTSVINSGQKGQKSQKPTDAHVLAGRLNTGWIMCDREPDPARKARLEDHWLRLLHDYEAACDQAGPRPEQKPDGRFSGNGGTMNATDRLRKLEDRLGLGACRRCEEFARSGFAIRMDGDDGSATDGDQTCPECGQVEPPPSFTIVIAERGDGPQ